MLLDNQVQRLHVVEDFTVQLGLMVLNMNNVLLILIVWINRML